VARSVAGVRSVEDRLQVNTGTVVGRTESDRRLNERVQQALANDPDTEDARIEVSTLHGVVQLAGFVDSNAQRDAAARVAGSVQGVRSVDDDLRLTPP
jgi:hyperosmotically inducible periplasmic protein